MVYFANKLKEMRLKAGLSQRQLAEKIGVTHSVISYYELQERAPSPEVLVKLARIFHVTTDYLLGVESKRVLNISDLDEEDVKYIMNTIDMLKNKKNN